MRHIVYPAPPVSVPEPPGFLRGQEWVLEDGARVSAWVYEGRSLTPGRPAVLFLHGNGENLETLRRAGLFEDLLALDVPFVALDYPGYGRSTGVPSEASLLEAGSLVLEWMGIHFESRPVVVVGWSLGAAVGIGLVAAGPESCSGLVALSAWTSLAEVGASHFPRWLVEIALADRYESAREAARITCPSLVIHGSEDRIIPIEQGRKVAATLGAEWVEVPAAGHNDLLAHGIVWERLSGFLATIESSAIAEGPSGPVR